MQVGLVACALLAALALAACDDDQGLNDSDLPQQLIEITVGEGGIDPETARVQPPDHYQLVVTNETDEDCSFDMGSWVNDLAVPANDTGQIDFVVPAQEPEGEVHMGCDGSEEQTGSVRVLEATVPG